MLTLQYDKTIYLIGDPGANRRLIGRYIDVYEYPDGRIELRTDSATLPYAIYDWLSEIDQGAIVEIKRLGHVLEVARRVQEQGDNRRGRSAPARTNQRKPPVKLKPEAGKKGQRELNAADLANAITQVQPI